MMTTRTACACTIIIGCLWAVIGLIYNQPIQDFAVGAAVAATGVLGIGLLDWIQR